MDEPSKHYPDHLLVALHREFENLATTVLHDILLFDQNRPIWRTAADSAGPVDVVAIELNCMSMQLNMTIRAYHANGYVESRYIPG
jgi:hypothetical protein